MDSSFSEDPNYSIILANVQFIQHEVRGLAQYSLIEEIVGLQYNIIGKESEKIQHIIFKDNAGVTLCDDDMDFLRNVYVVYYCAYAVIVDEPEEDDYV